MRHYKTSDFEHPVRYKIITTMISYLFVFPMMYFMCNLLFPMFEGDGLVFRNRAPLLGGFILTTFLIAEEVIDFDKARKKWLRQR